MGNEVEVELLADQHDVDAAYSEALDNLRVRKPTEAIKVKTASQEEQERKDYYVSIPSRSIRLSLETRLTRNSRLHALIGQRQVRIARNSRQTCRAGC